MANMKAEMNMIERRLGNLEAQTTLIANAMKGRKTNGLDLGLEELREGKVHKYRSVKELANGVWG